jgi:hypothetical protein
MLALAAGGLALYESWIRIPPNFLPWGPVVLDAEPGWFANIQLNGLSADGDACRAALGRATLKFSAIADRKVGEGCGFTDVVRADSTPIPFSPRPVATCAMTAGLYWWQRRLNEIAAVELDTHVTRIDQLGTYACRNINSAQPACDRQCDRHRRLPHGRWPCGLGAEGLRQGDPGGALPRRRA